MKRISPLSSRHGRTMDHLGADYPTGPGAGHLYPSALKSLAPSEKAHISFLAGIRILNPGRDPDRYSGYQVARMATELVPTYAAVLGES